jgi:hypothetical protein
MIKETMRRRISWSILLGLAGCGQPPADGDDTVGQSTAGLRVVHEGPIHVSDPNGRLRAGVALSTRPFAGDADGYLAHTQLMLRSAGDQATRPPFEVRLENARRALQETPFADPNPIAVAYVFEDDDVAGWTGSSLSEAAFIRTDRQKLPGDQTGIQRALSTTFWFDQVTVVHNVGASPFHLCQVAGYALGNRDPSSRADAQVSFQFQLGSTVDSDSPTWMTITAASPTYNWGNWWFRGAGFYRLWIQNINPIGAVTVNSTIGCLNF